MNRAVEGAESLAAMTDHRARKRCPGFGGNLDGAGDKEFVVRRHEENVERPILVRKPTADRLPNVQCRMQSGGSPLFFFLYEADVAAAFEARDFYFCQIFFTIEA